MARFFRRRKFCRFTAEGVKEIDFKDLNTLKAYISETGKIVPSRITGPSTSVSWPSPSSAPATWPCCPTPTATAVDSGLSISVKR